MCPAAGRKPSLSLLADAVGRAHHDASVPRVALKPLLSSVFARAAVSSPSPGCPGAPYVLARTWSARTHAGTRIRGSADGDARNLAWRVVHAGQPVCGHPVRAIGPSTVPKREACSLLRTEAPLPEVGEARGVHSNGRILLQASSNYPARNAES